MRIYQKWGFGMARTKPETDARRHEAATRVLDVLTSTSRIDHPVLDDLSTVKGLFTRSFKQDQWDWFTVWTQLGRPGRRSCMAISDGFRELRRAVREQDAASVASARDQLVQAGASRAIRTFLGREPEDGPGDGRGYIYILSTRSSPGILKIGYTDRTVEERVKEINSTTGVLEPYGARAVWVVDDAPYVEKIVHEALAAYRVRRDREFFELPYRTAVEVVGDIVGRSGGEK